MKRIAIVLLAAGALAGQTRGRLGEYALVLDDVPVAQKVHGRAAIRSEAAQAHVAKVRSAQGALVAELGRRGIAVTGSSQLLVNAVFVQSTREAAVELRSIPGVKRVQYLPPVKPALTTATNLINASAAWAAVGGAGNAGAGIKIGIIDTGIDQNHPGFQDASLTAPAGFPKGDGGYTSNKVIVARSYVSKIEDHYYPDVVFDYKAPDDESPRDRTGHGTAIAMIAAGVQHTSPLGMISGVAPKAFLGNYKVFGSPGVNDYTLFSGIQAALTDAVQDGMDIVTLSLNEGDPAEFGPLDSTACNDVACDVRAQAVENATSLGVMVVAAAGNGGNAGLKYPSLNSLATPGTAPSAVTVGATQNSHKLYQAVKVNGSGAPSNLQRINALFGDVKVNSPLTAPLKDVTSTGNDGLGCSALPAGSLSGAIALVQRGTCLFSDKINFAQAAGAVAVVIYQVDGNEDVYSNLYVQNTGIPAVLIGNTDGKALKSYLASNTGTTATLDPTITAVNNANVNTIAPFSSRGPSLGNFAAARDFALKPELVAPGSDIYTATQKYDPVGDAYNAAGYTTVTGTSYAVGFVAGAAAVAKQKNSNLNTPGRLKSALVNTASTSDLTGSVHVTDVGAGKLNVGDAVTVAATLEPAAISFGPVPAVLPVTRTLTITNVSGSAITLNLAVRPITGNSRATVSLSSSSVQLAAGGSTQLSISLGGGQRAPGAYEGFIDVTGAGPALHLPYYYVVGDGVAYNIQCIIDCSFTGSPNDTGWPLAFRVVDQYGVPVVNTPVGVQIKAGGGKINASGGDQQTDKLGNAEVFVDLGPNAGDQIFGDQIFLGGAGGLTQEFDGFARRVPSIQAGGVVNAATFALGQGVQPGSYITIFGSDLADTTAAASTTFLPLSLASVAVNFDGGGITLPGHLHFVSPGQINVQIPWEFEGQSSVRMKVMYAGYIFSPVFTVKLAPASPGSFGILDQNFGVVSASNAAKRGEVIQIFANGLGPASGHSASGEPATSVAACNSNPAVTIGGVNAPVQFCGLVPPFVGLYQLNVTVPPGVSAGTQPLVISSSGNSATVNLPVQ
jgi:uncharacterized protein (TIGR03437 family)